MLNMQDAVVKTVGIYRYVNLDKKKKIKPKSIDLLLFFANNCHSVVLLWFCRNR